MKNDDPSTGPVVTGGGGASSDAATPNLPVNPSASGQRSGGTAKLRLAGKSDRDGDTFVIYDGPTAVVIGTEPTTVPAELVDTITQRASESGVSVEKIED